MAEDPQASATKDDIRLLMEQIGTLYDANARGKEEIIATLEDRIDAKIAQSEDRVKRHFDVTVETIRHDLLGANKDRIENHEDRLTRLERHMKPIAA